METLVGGLLQVFLLPEVGGKVGVSALEGSVRGLGEVSEGSGLSSSGGVAIRDSSHGEELLGHGGGNKSGTTGSRDEADHDRGALSSDLAGNGVGLSDLVSPISSPDRDDGELGGDDGTTDGSGDFLRALDSKSDMAVVVSDGNESLEAGALSGTESLR